jgi:hypothetical protein
MTLGPSSSASPRRVRCGAYRRHVAHTLGSWRATCESCPATDAVKIGDIRDLDRLRARPRR